MGGVWGKGLCDMQRRLRMNSTRPLAHVAGAIDGKVFVSQCFAFWLSVFPVHFVACLHMRSCAEPVHVDFRPRQMPRSVSWMPWLSQRTTVSPWSAARRHICSSVSVTSAGVLQCHSCAIAHATLATYRSGCNCLCAVACTCCTSVSCRQLCIH
jgi:hypothetical protein